jgi:hypothetical protein
MPARRRQVTFAPCDWFTFGWAAGVWEDFHGGVALGDGDVFVH